MFSCERLAPYDDARRCIQVTIQSIHNTGTVVNPSEHDIIAIGPEDRLNVSETKP